MRRTAQLVGTAVFLLFAGVACEEEPCDEYVDYMCACHDGEPGIDCEEYERLYLGADPDVQDQCALDLEEQEALDDASGHECVGGGDTGV